MVQVGLDGVMMRMNAEKYGDEVIEKEGWREASCGTVTPRDDGGNRLYQRAHELTFIQGCQIDQHLMNSITCGDRITL